MERLDGRARKVEAEICLGLGRVQVVQNSWSAPIDVFATSPEHHLELSLLPRSTLDEGCFPEYWSPDRFEPIGEVFLLPAHQVVHAKSDCQRQTSIVCNFDPHAVAEWFDGRLQWTDTRLRGSLNLASTPVRNLLFRIGAEVRTPGFARETMVELLAGQIVVELFRHLIDIDAPRTGGGLSPWRLRLIEDRLAERGPPPSLTELAQLCRLSVRHLTRAFRASRGQSIGSYVAEHRIDLAKRLLASGTCVKAVAYETGFSAPSNFTTAFLRATGETPRRFKQRLSGKAQAPSLPQKTH